MKKIGIIVPLYYGVKYVNDLIHQIEMCVMDLPKQYEVTLWLINDAPDDPIDEQYHSNIVSVMIKNTDKNRGIHGSRVYGLSLSQDDYVVFLDQDDKLYPDYLSSQLNLMEKLGADAVVCRCVHEKKQYYNVDFPFEKMITKEYMMTQGCPIISPGQVLFQRTSIPKYWTEHIMTTNCADDYLLYLCMAKENKKFVLNQQVAFEHVVNGVNTSWDVLKMTESEKEMVKILIDNKIYVNEDADKLELLLENIMAKRLTLFSKFRKMFFVINKMLELKEKGIFLSDYLLQKSIHRVAIYGAGYVGKRLKGELESSSLEIEFYIDRNAHYIEEDIDVYTLEEAPENVDAVIVTLAQGYEMVIKNLCEKYGNKVYLLSELENLLWEAKSND